MKLKLLFLSLCTAVSVLGASAHADAAHLEDIQKRGVLLVGTTGDYKPMSYLNPQSGQYEGFDTALSQLLAQSLHVSVRYVPTTWKSLTADTKAGRFDVAMSGITRTLDREQVMNMSDGYIVFGKTILCRQSDSSRFHTLSDMNKKSVRVMVNPGGTNEKFARAFLPQSTLIIHEKNAEIPNLIAEGKADIMITETMEAAHYIKADSRLSAPVLDQPFTKNQFGILTQKGDQDFLNYLNFFLHEMELNGTIEKLESQYIL